MSLVTRTSLALEISHRDLPNRVTTSCTPVGHSAGSSHPILRPLPAMNPDAEILEAYHPDLGYDADNFPYKQT
jgi:hypothetical protein